jgi:hypothetical protein
MLCLERLFLGLSSDRLIEEDIDRLESRKESASLWLQELISYRDKSGNVPIPVREELYLPILGEYCKDTGDIVAILISDRGTLEKQLETSILHHSEKIWENN